MAYLNTFLLKPFPLLDETKDKWRLIIFMGLFVVVFMNLFVPFNADEWPYANKVIGFFALSGYGIFGAIVLIFSQFVLRPLLGLKTFTYGSFLLFVTSEILLISIVMYLIYGEKMQSYEQIVGEFFLTAKYTSLVSIIPYSSVLLFTLVKKEQEKLKSYTIQRQQEVKEHLLSFRDENGKIMLTIKRDHLLFLKSEDNYTAVYYLTQGKMGKKLIRTNLKKLESENHHAHLLRTHRSYMVNLQNVETINRTQKGYNVALRQLQEMTIPVSSGYKKSFEERMKF